MVQAVLCREPGTRPSPTPGSHRSRTATTKSTRPGTASIDGVDALGITSTGSRAGRPCRSEQPADARETMSANKSRANALERSTRSGSGLKVIRPQRTTLPSFRWLRIYASISNLDRRQISVRRSARSSGQTDNYGTRVTTRETIQSGGVSHAGRIVGARVLSLRRCCLAARPLRATSRPSPWTPLVRRLTRPSQTRRPPTDGGTTIRTSTATRWPACRRFADHLHHDLQDPVDRRRPHRRRRR